MHWKSRFRRHLYLKFENACLSLAFNFLFHVLRLKLECLTSSLWSHEDGSDATEEFESDDDEVDDEPGLHESSRFGLESPSSRLLLNLSSISLSSLSIGSIDWGEGITGASASHGSESPDGSEDNPEESRASNSAGEETSESRQNGLHSQASNNAEEWDSEAW